MSKRKQPRGAETRKVTQATPRNPRKAKKPKHPPQEQPSKPNQHRHAQQTRASTTNPASSSRKLEQASAIPSNLHQQDTSKPSCPTQQKPPEQTQLTRASSNQSQPKQAKLPSSSQANLKLFQNNINSFSFQLFITH